MLLLFWKKIEEDGRSPTRTTFSFFKPSFLLLILLWLVCGVPHVAEAVFEEIEVQNSNSNGFELGELSLSQFVLGSLIFLNIVVLYTAGVLPIEVDLGFNGEDDYNDYYYFEAIGDFANYGDDDDGNDNTFASDEFSNNGNDFGNYDFNDYGNRRQVSRRRRLLSRRGRGRQPRKVSRLRLQIDKCDLFYRKYLIFFFSLQLRT